MNALVLVHSCRLDASNKAVRKEILETHNGKSALNEKDLHMLQSTDDVSIREHTSVCNNTLAQLVKACMSASQVCSHSSSALHPCYIVKKR